MTGDAGVEIAFAARILDEEHVVQQRHQPFAQACVVGSSSPGRRSATRRCVGEQDGAALFQTAPRTSLARSPKSSPSVASSSGRRRRPPGSTSNPICRSSAG